MTEGRVLTPEEQRVAELEAEYLRGLATDDLAHDAARGLTDGS